MKSCKTFIKTFTRFKTTAIIPRMRKYFLTISLILVMSFPVMGEDAGKIEIVGSQTIDLGKYPAWESKTAVYRIRNAGNNTLKILKIHKTCGCASAQCNKDSLEPKEEASVKVVILNDSISGLYSKNTFVETSDPDNRFLRLTVTGNAVPLIDVRPSDSFYAGRIKANSEWSHSFELAGSESNIVLGDPELESNYPADIRMKGKDGYYHLDIILHPSTNSGDFRCSVSVPFIEPTNHSPLKLSVSGKIGAELVAVPGVVILPVSEEPTTKSFRLRVLGKRTFVLKSETVKMDAQDGITYKVKADPESNNNLFLDVVFSPEYTQKLHMEQNMELSFSVPGLSSAKIFCRAKTSSP